MHSGQWASSSLQNSFAQLVPLHLPFKMEGKTVLWSIFIVLHNLCHSMAQKENPISLIISEIQPINRWDILSFDFGVYSELNFAYIAMMVKWVSLLSWRLLEEVEVLQNSSMDII